MLLLSAGLQALTPWIASGHAHEVHLSDLGGPVSPDTVYELLKATNKHELTVNN